MRRMASMSEGLILRTLYRSGILLSLILAHLEAAGTRWREENERNTIGLLTRISDRRILKPRCNSVALASSRQHSRQRWLTCGRATPRSWSRSIYRVTMRAD